MTEKKLLIRRNPCWASDAVMMGEARTFLCIVRPGREVPTVTLASNKPSVIRHMSVKARSHHYHYYGYSRHHPKPQRRKCRPISDRLLRRAAKKGNTGPWERERFNYGKELALLFKPRWTAPNLVST